MAQFNFPVLLSPACHILCPGPQSDHEPEAAPEVVPGRKADPEAAPEPETESEADAEVEPESDPGQIKIYMISFIL